MGFYLEQAKELINEDYISTKYKNTFYLNGKSGAVLIHVRTDEGDYEPHFHLEIVNNHIKGCIKIAEAAYFNHKDYHKLNFNKSEAEELNKWMKKINRDTGFSNYKTIIIIWNSGKGNNIKLDPDREQPDYSLL